MRERESYEISVVFQTQEKTNINTCYNVNTGGPVELPWKIKSTNDGGLYRCINIKNLSNPIEATKYYVMVFIRRK